MSCMIMSPEPLAAIANATETLLNCGYEYFGFGATRQMHKAFQDCQNCGVYEAESIYKKLYAVNVAAYNSHYKDRKTPVDDEAPTIDGSRYKVHQLVEYTEHGLCVVIRPWYYNFSKFLGFWLYQTSGDATRNDPIRAAMVDFKNLLFEFIVTHSSEYVNAHQ